MKTALIITSIAGQEHTILQEYAIACKKKKIDFYLMGDTKSPAEFHIDGCNFYSISQQEALPFALAKILPKAHYGRKNLGYLLAIQNNAEVIAETDDDNIPMSEFWNKPEQFKTCYRFSLKGWINIYAYFTKNKIWARGFPLQFLSNEAPPLTEALYEEVNCPIQQGLANGNPDVDAVYRLTSSLPVTFKHAQAIALGKNTWSPFNSQNTRWFKPAFPLLYLPSFCSFRMTDIWRSFIAQRICWENNWNVYFHKPSVVQLRNEHNLLRDFEDEIPGFLHNDEIIRMLENLKLQPGEKYLLQNLTACYEAMVQKGFIKENELGLLKAWCEDMKGLN